MPDRLTMSDAKCSGKVTFGLGKRFRLKLERAFRLLFYRARYALAMQFMALTQGIAASRLESEVF
jgi:hypothetical protein